MSERIDSKTSKIADYNNFSPETSKLSPQSNLDSLYDSKIVSERFSNKLTPFREESVESVDTVIKNTPINSPEKILKKKDDSNNIPSRVSNVQLTKSSRYLSESENLDDTLISKTSLDNLSRNTRKFREEIPTKFLTRNSKRYGNERIEIQSPRNLVLRQRYPSYDSFARNNRHIFRPHTSYKRRHLNVAGDNIVSKSLTRNYIYHRQPFDWYNSSSGILIDDVEEIIPIPGGLDEPHLNAPYEKSSSEEREDDDYDYHKDNRENLKKNKFNDSEKYYEKDRILTKSNNRKFDDLSEHNLISNNKQKSNSENDILSDYENEREKKSEIFSNDEKKVSQMFLKRNFEINMNDGNVYQSQNTNEEDETKAHVTINAHTVTINADNVKNIPNNINKSINNNDNRYSYSIGSEDLDTLLRAKLNNILNLQSKSMMQNYQIQQSNEFISSRYTNSNDQTDLQELTNEKQIFQPIIQKTFPINFQLQPKNNNSDVLVKSILKDVVTVATEDAKKIIDGNPFDENTNVYKMIHGNRSNINKVEKNFSINDKKVELKKNQQNKGGIDILQNLNLIKNKNKTINSNKLDNNTKSKGSIKLSAYQNEKLNKLCEDIRIFSINEAKKSKKV